MSSRHAVAAVISPAVTCTNASCSGVCSFATAGADAATTIPGNADAPCAVRMPVAAAGASMSSGLPPTPQTARRPSARGDAEGIVTQPCASDHGAGGELCDTVESSDVDKIGCSRLTSRM
jgi:hypothetical protein